MKSSHVIWSSGYGPTCLSNTARWRHNQPGHRQPAGDGQCLLGAFAAPDAELGYSSRTETATGLRRERFLSEFTTPVTAEDVAQAPPEHRARLQVAAESGQRARGDHQAKYHRDQRDQDFAPAAPFVGARLCARAAAITVALLTGYHVPEGCDGSTTF